MYLRACVCVCEHAVCHLHLPDNDLRHAPPHAAPCFLLPSSVAPAPATAGGGMISRMQSCRDGRQREREQQQPPAAHSRAPKVGERIPATLRACASALCLCIRVCVRACMCIRVCACTSERSRAGGGSQSSTSAAPKSGAADPRGRPRLRRRRPNARLCVHSAARSLHARRSIRSVVVACCEPNTARRGAARRGGPHIAVHEMGSCPTRHRTAGDSPSATPTPTVRCVIHAQRRTSAHARVRAAHGTVGLPLPPWPCLPQCPSSPAAAASPCLAAP